MKRWPDNQSLSSYKSREGRCTKSGRNAPRFPLNLHAEEKSTEKFDRKVLMDPIQSDLSSIIAMMIENLSTLNHNEITSRFELRQNTQRKR